MFDMHYIVLQGLYMEASPYTEVSEAEVLECSELTLTISEVVKCRDKMVVTYLYLSFYLVS